MPHSKLTLLFLSCHFTYAIAICMLYVYEYCNFNFRFVFRYAEAIPLLETIFCVREKLLTIANVHVVLVLCELVNFCLLVFDVTFSIYMFVFNGILVF